jgi:hypothetical protein
MDIHTEIIKLILAELRRNVNIFEAKPLEIKYFKDRNPQKENCPNESSISWSGAEAFTAELHQ